MRISKPRLLLTFLLWPLAAGASSTQVMDLADLLQLAEHNDTLWQAAQARYRAELETENLGEAPLLPQLDFNAFSSHITTRTRNSTSAVAPDGESRFASSGYSLDLSQTLYDQSLFEAADAASARVAAARARLQAAQQDLLMRVAEAWLDVLGKQDALAFARAEQQAIGKQLEQNRERFAAGLVNVTDVRDSQAQYDLAVANTIVAQNALDISRENLRLITGQRAGELAGIRENLPLFVPQPDDVEAWQHNALANNPLLIASRYQLDAANRDLASRSAQHYPTLSLNARHSFTSSDGSAISNAFSGRDVTDNRLTLNLNVPVYSGGATSAAARQAHARRDAAQAELAQQLRLTITGVRTAFFDLKTSMARVEALHKALASTRAATEAAILGFESGVRNSIDVLLAQREQYASENRHAQARYDYLLNRLRLKQAAGSLSVEDLLHINKLVQR